MSRFHSPPPPSSPRSSKRARIGGDEEEEEEKTKKVTVAEVSNDEKRWMLLQEGARVGESLVDVPTSEILQMGLKQLSLCVDMSGAIFHQPSLSYVLDLAIESFARIVEMVTSAQECIILFSHEHTRKLMMTKRINRDRSERIVAQLWRTLARETDLQRQREWVSRVTTTSSLPQIGNFLLRSKNTERIQIGLGAFKLIEASSPGVAPSGQWRALWALNLLPTVSQDSLVVLSEMHTSQLKGLFLGVDEKYRFVNAALSGLSPYDTPTKRLAAVRVFGLYHRDHRYRVLAQVTTFMRDCVDDGPDFLLAAFDLIVGMGDLHQAELSCHAVSKTAFSLLTHTDTRVAAKACTLATLVLQTYKRGWSGFTYAKQHMASAGFLSLATIRPLLASTYATLQCRENTFSVLLTLSEEVVLSPLAADPAFLNLLFETLQRNESCAPSVCSLLARIVTSPSSSTLSAKVVPRLLDQIQLGFAPEASWDILRALKSTPIVQENQLHPFYIHLVHSSAMPLLEGPLPSLKHA